MRAVAMTAVVALMAVFTGTAHAAPNHVSDGYEGNYGERWVGNTGTFTPDGMGTGGVETDGVNAYKGSNNGWLFAAGGWASHAVQIDVRGWADRTDCEARVMAKPRDSEENPGLRVFDPNGWKVLASGGGSFLPPGQYTQIVTRRFDLSGVDSVYLEVILGSGRFGRLVRYDEFELECF